MVPILELAVLEPDKGGIARLLGETMGKAPRLRLVKPRPGMPLQCDLLVVSPAWQGGGVDAQCRILLTPPGTAGRFCRLTADWVVSFGPSPQDSISFSSLEGSSLVLSIGREIPTLTGGVLEIQELPVRCPVGAAAGDALAACAAALLAGCGPFPCINPRRGE